MAGHLQSVVIISNKRIVGVAGSYHKHMIMTFGCDGIGAAHFGAGLFGCEIH